MKHFILAPDSFKGTMSSMRVCEIMMKAIRKHVPDADIISIPVADGGEGSVDCFLAAVGGRKEFVSVKGPYFEDIQAFYGVLPDQTAVIEMAAAAGLPLVEDRKAAEKTTTFGVGQLIAHAARQGCKKMVVGLGGSATNDGGAGAAAALGVRFFNKQNQSFVPVGETLQEISRIDASGLMKELESIQITTMCDIDNPLYGESGAASVFGPQKGATPATIQMLDQGLAHLSDLIEHDLGISVKDIPGAGAAGGMGAGMVAFLGSELQMGIETVLDVTGFNDLLKNADLVFSGEGKIDSQSIRGKVVIGIAKRTKVAGVPLVAVVGDIGEDIELAYEMGVSGIFSINRVAKPFSEVKKRCESDLYLTMDNLMRYNQIFSAI